MRTLLSAVALVAAISLTTPIAEANIFGLFGFDCCGGHNCGCKSCGSCGNCCEPCCGTGCGCYANTGCCEPACGCNSCCEPCCGCGSCCNGRQYACQTFNCCCNTYTPICPCVGNCNNGCGGCCEPACGCSSCGEPCCGCGTGCGQGCAPSWCGSGTACCPRKCCLKNYGFCCCCGHVVDAFCKCCPCGGCSGEVYWNEWHNDPPYCQDPCNSCGQFTGGCGGYGCNDGCCNGGCSTGSCGCDGCTSQTGSTNGSAAYVRQTPAQAKPTQVATGIRPNPPANGYRSAYAGKQFHPSYQMAQTQQGQGQPQMQQQQIRTASRPMNNSRMPASNGNGAQPRPILW